MIDRATVQKIKDTADIVEVVSDYVHLVRRGANYMGLCPFHNERTPSFSVNKARNYCYCFSCHKGGSPVNFIMEKEGISYHDALLQLAKKYGIKVEEKELTDEEREAQSRREGMYVANEWAMKYFEQNLTDTPDGRDIGLTYLYGRGVTDEAIKAFHLGYAIDRGSDFLSAAKKKGFDVNILKGLGLVGTSQQGNDYDRFRGRVIFPIMNTSGKVVAFGGRDLKGGPAKYINSPESELYKKSNELYGMYQARQAMVREDKCFLVEGYLDVIGMWQSGMKNVVASSGTALTDGQIALIHRFTKNVTLIYDGDAAGIKASLRGIDMLLSHQLDVNVLLLPDGHDPDSFARAHTPEEFRDFVRDNETDIIRFKAKVLMAEVQNQPQRRVAAIRSVVQSLACIPDKVKRDVYIQECSIILNVPEESISQATADARAVIVEQLKKQRRAKELQTDLDTGKVASQNPPGQSYPPNQSQDGISTIQSNFSGTGTSPNQTSERIPTNQAQQEQRILRDIKTPVQNPLKPLEWEVLEYCIRYGFMKFCDLETEEGGKYPLSVIEYVADELDADEVKFSVPEYALVFDTLNNLYVQYQQELPAFMSGLEVEEESLRKKGFDEIFKRDLSVEGIKKEETKLEESLASWRQDKIVEFAKSYPAKELGSHEDGTVRRLTTEAISEKHQLSQIYSRERPAEKEEDKLITLIPTAISVWKNGLLDIRFNSLIQEFRNIAHKGMPEEEKRMQAKLAEIIAMRSQLAKTIGDRILYPSASSRRSVKK